MSVDEPVDVSVDDNSVRSVVTERRELEIDDLFVDGELRLWEDEAGWSGYTREVIDEDVVVYHRVNRRHDDERWRFLTFHDLRRTWAGQLANADVDETVALRWGGWSDLNTFLDHYRGEATAAAQRRERKKVDWL